jgi:hypothetical protein
MADKKTTGKFIGSGMALLFVFGCAAEEPSEEPASFGCMADVGLFEYCGEYREVPRDSCEKSGGTYYDECPSGWVGKCEVDADVNPRVTYFYGDALTEDAVRSVCPNGKITLGGAGAAGNGGSGGTTGSGGSAPTGGTGTGGSTGSSTCNDIDNAAPFVRTLPGERADASEPAGGEIVSGTYHHTSSVAHGSSAAPSSPMATTIRVLAESSTMQMVMSYTSGASLVRADLTLVFQTSGTTLSREFTCGIVATAYDVSYTATPEYFELIERRDDGYASILVDRYERID